MDRFYTTLDVVDYLGKHDFGVYGMIMKNRGKLSDQMQLEIGSLAMHESLFYKSLKRNILLTVWRDSKVLHLVSNIGDDSIGITQRRIKKSESYTREEVPCPNTVKTYSQTSRGVDLLDQMIGYYNANIRLKKWYKSIILHLLQVSLYNSFLLYNNASRTKINFINFQENIIRELLAPTRIAKTVLFTPQKKLQKVEPIIMEPIPGLCKLVKQFKRYCYICEKTGTVRRQTTYYCSTHEKSVCVIPCYDIHIRNMHI